MIRRVLLLLGLGVALTGGIVTAVHAAGQTASRPAIHATAHANAATVTEAPEATSPEAQTDSDAHAPCATSSTGEQTGNCAIDSQATGGSQDAAGTANTDASP